MREQEWRYNLCVRGDGRESRDGRGKEQIDVRRVSQRITTNVVYG